MTITEALAEIKTIEKRLDKQRQFVLDHIFLQGQLKDPLAGEGGSRNTIKETRQAITDLESRIVFLRSAISEANTKTFLTIDHVARTIADWLVWRREVAAGAGQFLNGMNRSIQSVRQQAQQKQWQLTEKDAKGAGEVTVYVSEKELMQAIDQHEKILGDLDGQLSLLNATTHITPF